MTKKTFIRNFFTVTIILLVSIAVLGLIACTAHFDEGTKNISDATYYNAKSVVLDTKVDEYYLEYTRDLCRSAITEETGKNITEDFIRIAYIHGIWGFDYFYHSDDGFFQVATLGDANKLASLIEKNNVANKKLSERSFFEITYDGDYLTITERFSGPDHIYNLETITEEEFYDGKPNITDSEEINNDYLAKTKDLCKSAISKKTGEKIYDHYIVVWRDDTESLTFSYVYRSDNGFFKVPSIGDDNLIARSIINETGILKEVSSYEIKYDGNILKVTCACE